MLRRLIRAPIRRLLLPLLLAAASCTAAHAASLRYCDQPADLSATQKDRLFRLGGLIKAELEASGQGVALIARSGLDLDRFKVRYSHAGLSLKASANTPWSVRQLYFACEERRPRVFDQGLSGFLLGLNDPSAGYVSVVFLSPDAAHAVERAALDDRNALRLLGATYSANAYAFSAVYQNCNQWVAELLAATLGRLDEAYDIRVQAQGWLKDNGYVPSLFEVGFGPLLWLGMLVPWLHRDDHPDEDLKRAQFRVSMPASLEAFVRAKLPQAHRVEFCLADGRVVIHRGWDAIADGCRAGADDTVIVLDN